MPRVKKIQNQNAIGAYKHKKIAKQVKYQPEDRILSLKKIQDQKVVVIYDFPEIKVDKRKKSLAIPTFRADRLSYTPGFSLPDQFNRQYNENQKFSHHRKIQYETNQIQLQNIEVAKPSQRSNHCMICRVKFQNYREHIQQIQHVNRVKNSTSSKFINELCDKFKIERFFRDCNNNNEENLKEQSSFVTSCSNIFFEDLNQKDRKKCDNVTKEILYQLVKQQFKNQLKQNLRQSNTKLLVSQDIFDVLQF